jgi:6,7-dimethyl-8-ribityllumazine synthase
MAQTSYNSRVIPAVPGANIAIVMSKWYREYSEAMIAKCLEVLEAAQANAPIVHVVPGSLEIPLAARRLVKRDPQLEAIIVFGVILKGDTYHFDMVKDLCMSGLEKVMFECDIPIINEVLPVDRIELVAARCADDDKNKGIEAGLAAIEIIEWRRRHPLTA